MKDFVGLAGARAKNHQSQWTLQLDSALYQISSSSACIFNDFFSRVKGNVCLMPAVCPMAVSSAQVTMRWGPYVVALANLKIFSFKVFNQDAAPIQITSNGDTQLHFAVGDPIGIVARRAGLRVQSGSDAASQVFDATARQCVPRIKAVHRSHGPSSDKPSAQVSSLRLFFDGVVKIESRSRIF